MKWRPFREADAAEKWAERRRSVDAGRFQRRTEDQGRSKFLSIPDGQVLYQEKAPMHLHDFELDATGDGLVGCGHGKLITVEFK